MKKIEPYKTTLSSHNAYWMARDEAEILDDLKHEDSKFISVRATSKNSAQAALIEHEKYFCIAFRGTVMLWNLPLHL